MIPLGVPRRSDALPEEHEYRDTGCRRIGPSCLRCPLDQCRYDGNSLPMRQAKEREKRCRELAAGGMGINEIATTIGVSRRSVFRYLQGVSDMKT